MKHCKINKKDLLLYVFELIKENKRVKINQHLKECEKCNIEIKKLLQLKSTIHTAVPQSTIPSEAQLILDQAKNLKPVQKENVFQSIGKRINEVIGNVILNPRYKLAFQITTIICVISIFLFFFISKPANHLYFVKFSGNVKVNNICLANKYKYDLKEEIEILTEKGHCAFQVNKSQIFILHPETRLSINNKEGTKINLKRGGFYGFVDNKRIKKKVVINVNDLKFTVTGTKFHITCDKEELTKLTVLSGEVRTLINGEDIIITGGNTFIKDSNQMKLNALGTSEKRELDKWTQYKIMDEIEDVNFVKISAIQKNVKIYDKENMIGITPLSFLNKKGPLSQELTLHKKGFFPYDIILSPEKDYIFNVKLLKLKKSKILWKFKIKKNLLSIPLRYKGYLIIGDINGWVYNLDIKKEKILWIYKTQGKISLSPNIYKNVVFIFSGDSYLYAFDLSKGKLLWKRNAGIIKDSRPLFTGNNIYFGNTKGTLYGINIFNGKIKFEMKFNKGFRSPCQIKEDILYVGNLNGYFYAIDRKKRKVIWKYKTSGKIVSSEPLILENTVCFGSCDRYLYALNRKTGSFLWKFKINSRIFSSPVQIDNRIIFSTSNGWIYALDNYTREIKRKSNTYTKNLLSPVIYKDKYILVGNKTNDIFVFTKYGLKADKLNILFKEFNIYKNTILCWNQKEIFSYCINF